MFNASQFFCCHLLLGNRTLALIIIGSLVLLNRIVIGDDINNQIKLLFKNQNIFSVQSNLVNFNAKLNTKKIKYNYLPTKLNNIEESLINENLILNEENKIFRLKKRNLIRLKKDKKTNENERKQQSINHKSTIKSGNIRNDYIPTEIFESNKEKIAAINYMTNDINKIMTTSNANSINNTISNSLISTTTSTTSTMVYTTTTTSPTTLISTNTINSGSSTTNFKGSSTNYGYKYDREWRKFPSRLNKDAKLSNWNDLLKLVFLLLISTAGTTGNIFVISTIMLIEQFQVQGNSYIASIALAQLLISVISLPATCIEVMSVKPNNSICHLQWLFTQFSLVIILLNFMLISIENLSALRSRSLINHNLFCSKFRVITLVLLTWLIAFIIVYTQNVNELAPALCKFEINKNKIWLEYHLSIAIGVVILPTLITILCFLRSSFKVKKINEQFELNPLDTPWLSVAADGELVKANIMVYIYIFLMYLPLCILAPLSVFKTINHDWLNFSWSLSMFSACSACFVYPFANQNFGKTFFKLFYYCCCKTHLQFESKTSMYIRRNLASTTGTNTNMELRVHILPGLNMNQRSHDHHNQYLNHHHHHISSNSSIAKPGPRTIPAQDGGLGFGGHPKYHSRIDSSDPSGSNYSGSSLLNRYGTRSQNSFSSHLVDAKDYSMPYGDYSKNRSYGSNQKYFI